MPYRWINGKLEYTEPSRNTANELDSLVGQRDRMEAEIEELKGDSNPGLFDRIKGSLDFVKPSFGGAIDVISRPSYAVAEGIASAIDPDKRSGAGGSALDAAVGIGRGLWGTKKTSNIETLNEHGVKGPLSVALGLAGDILLDPTTYAGAAPLKAVGKAERAAKGADALAGAADKLRNVEDVKKFGYFDKADTAARAASDKQAATKEILEAAIKKGKEGTGKAVSKKENKRLIKERAKEITAAREASTAAAAEKNALKRINTDVAKAYGVAKRAETPKHVGRKMAAAAQESRIARGKKPYTTRQMNAMTNKYASEEVLDIAQSAKKVAEDSVNVQRAGLKVRFGKRSTELRPSDELADAFNASRVGQVTKKMVDSDLVQHVNKMFRTEGTFGKVLNESRKLKAAGGVARYYDTKDTPIILSSGNSLSWDNVMHGLTDDEAHTFFKAYENGIVDSLPATSANGLNFEDVAELQTRLMDNIYDSELEQGLIPFKKDKQGNPILTEDGKKIPLVPKIDHYIYHRATKGQKKYSALKKKTYTKAVASDGLDSNLPRTLKTAEDAPDGVSINTDIRKATADRIAKHTQALARKDFLTDAMDNFGIRVDTAATKRMLRDDGHKLVSLKKTLENADIGAAVEYIPDNMFVLPEIAEKLGGIQTIANNPGPVMALADKVLKLWKPAVTVYNPGHHIRNLASDVVLGHMDGVKYKDYSTAASIVFNGKIDGVMKLGDGELPLAQIIKQFKETGAAPGFIQTEVGSAFIGKGNVAKDVASKVSGAVHGVAEKREEFARLAHFLSSLREEAAGISHKGVFGPAMEEAAVRASTRVRKWHLDYSDLTDFERVTMRRIIPFYTWMRKSTPLMIEAMALRPGKVVNMDKTFNALMMSMGADPGEALPQDMIPHWIRETAHGQLGNSSRGNPMFWTPPLPQAEPFAWTDGGLTGAFRQGLSSINPIPKAIIELGMGQSAFTGAPIQQGVGNYATGLIPVGRVLSRLSGVDKDPDSYRGNTQLLSYLTGMGIHETPPKSLRSEIRKQMDPLQAQIGPLREANPALAESIANRGKPKAQFRWKDGKLVKS